MDADINICREIAKIDKCTISRIYIKNGQVIDDNSMLGFAVVDPINNSDECKRLCKKHNVNYTGDNRESCLLIIKSNKLKERNMLLYIAMADAYGAGYEFMKAEQVKEKHKFDGYLEAWVDKTPGGMYTDDTQMSIAIAELMINEPVWDMRIVSDYFLKAFKRDPRQTYARGFYGFLTQTENANDFVKGILPGSVKNGSAMRSVPLGFIKDKAELIDKATVQAAVTHGTKEGILASKAVALMAHYFIHTDGKKAGLHDYITKETGTEFSTSKTSRCACDALDTIDAVMTVLMQAKTLKEVIDLSVVMGGDTDSVAAIACGVASLTSEYKDDLPVFLLDDLEDGKYGKAYLSQLNKQLVEKFAT